MGGYGNMMGGGMGGYGGLRSFDGGGGQQQYGGGGGMGGGSPQLDMMGHVIGSPQSMMAGMGGGANSLETRLPDGSIAY